MVSAHNVLLINNLVLPFLVDESISLSTRSPKEPASVVYALSRKPWVYLPHFSYVYITRPAHLSSWTPPKPDILYTALGTRTIYRTLLLESAQSRDIQHKIHTQRAPFLPPSSAQVHLARARAPTTSRLCYTPCTAIAPEIRFVYNPATPACTNHR